MFIWDWNRLFLLEFVLWLDKNRESNDSSLTEDIIEVYKWNL
jgi:hypothetical protein